MCGLVLLSNDVLSSYEILKIIQDINAFCLDLLGLKLPNPMTNKLLPGLRRTVWKSLLWSNLCLIIQPLNTCMFISVNRAWITVLYYLRVSCHLVYFLGNRRYSRIYSFNKEINDHRSYLIWGCILLTRHNALMCTIWKTLFNQIQ